MPNKEEGGTRIFLAGLLDWIGASKPTQDILEKSDVKLVAQGEAHIKTITIRGAQIEGRIDLEKCKVDIHLELSSSGYSKNSYVLKGFKYIAKATVADHSCLSTRSTWGYEVINTKARKLLK